MLDYCSRHPFAADCAANQAKIAAHRATVKAAIKAALAALQEPALDED